MLRTTMLTGVLLLAGCSDQGYTYSDALTLKEGNVQLGDQEYVLEEITFGGVGRIRLEVEQAAGASTGVYWVGHQGRQHWLNLVEAGMPPNAQLRHTSELSVDPLTGQFDSGWLDYEDSVRYLLIENTDFGSSMPSVNGVDNVAMVSYRVTKKSRQ